MNRDVELGSHVVSWTVFRFRSQQLVLWTLLFWECVPSRLLKEQVAKCTGCFADTGEVLTVLKCILFCWWQLLNVALRPERPQGLLGAWGARDGHLDFHTAPELCDSTGSVLLYVQGDHKDH